MQQAVELGLVEDFSDTKSVEEYLQYSTVFTHELGNRRYGSFAFLVDELTNELVMVNTLEPVCRTCKGTRKEPAFEVCEICDGEGCRSCMNFGGYSTQIRCQTCKEIKQ